MNSPSVMGSKSKENLQEFLDMVLKVTDAMGVKSGQSAELATYQLQDMAHTLFKQQKSERVGDGRPIDYSPRVEAS